MKNGENKRREPEPLTKLDIIWGIFGTITLVCLSLLMCISTTHDNGKTTEQNIGQILCLPFQLILLPVKFLEFIFWH